MAKPKEPETMTAPPTETEPIVIPILEPEAIKVSIPTAQYKPALPTKKYWVGLRKEFKHRSQVDVAGVSFSLIVTPVQPSEDGGDYRNRYLGQVVNLTDEDVEKVKRRLMTKVVRGGYLVDVDKVHQRPQPGDEPLARFVYMVRLPDGHMPNRDVASECPEAMAQEG